MAWALPHFWFASTISFLSHPVITCYIITTITTIVTTIFTTIVITITSVIIVVITIVHHYRVIQETVFYNLPLADLQNQINHITQ